MLGAVFMRFSMAFSLKRLMDIAYFVFDFLKAHTDCARTSPTAKKG
jgi:hypothetical protein